MGSEELPEVGRRHVVTLPPMESDAEFYLVSAAAEGEDRYGRWKMPDSPLMGRPPVLMATCTTEVPSEISGQSKD